MYVIYSGEPTAPQAESRQGAGFYIPSSGILILWDYFFNFRMRACYKNAVLGIFYILDCAFINVHLRKFKLILKLNYISLLRTVQTFGKKGLGQNVDLFP